MKKFVILSSIAFLIFATLSTTQALAFFKKFSDVNYTQNSFYLEALDRMSEKQVVNGYEDGRFGPDDFITRAQLVTILDRYDQKLRENLIPSNSGVQKNWSIYKNPTYHYTLNYPTSWPINSKSAENVELGVFPSEPGPGVLFVNIKKQNSPILIEEITKNYESCEQPRDEMVANLLAIKLVCTEAFAGHQLNQYLFLKEGHLYNISFIQGSEEMNEIYEKMIQSFDFEAKA